MSREDTNAKAGIAAGMEATTMSPPVTFPNYGMPCASPERCWIMSNDKLREVLIAHEKVVVRMILSLKDVCEVPATSQAVTESREAFLAALADSADTPPEPTEEIARKVWHEVWDTGNHPIDIQMAEEEFDTYWVALHAALVAAHTKQEE